MFHIKVTEEMGRGIYASEKIESGDIVMRCELLVLSETDTPIVNNTDLKYYTFKFNETQDCLVLGLGEIFNHADKPNVSYRLVKQDERFVMEFRALTQIGTDEQLFIDYTADEKVNVSKYISTGSLVG